MMKAKKSHSMDAVFVVLTFMIFTMAGVVALILGVNLYKHTVDRADDNASLRAASGYIREMVRQNDVSNTIEVCNFDGYNALRIHKDGEVLQYIYAKDGYLKELYTKEDSAVSPTAGKDIMPIAVCAFEIAEEGMLKAYLVDDGEHIENIYINLKGER
ncbi:MAG: DUF4860 domain-containing protein [Lachnospiraceae bacterium]|nr:DUF4860 domain-containing protein [Lachnospiraceae bacterium]